MDAAQLSSLRLELIEDPAGLGYAAVPIDPSDSGAQHVGMHALLHARSRPGVAMVPAETVIAAFTPQEWAAAKALPDAEVQWWRDRLMSRNEPVAITPGGTFGGGLAFLVAKGAVSQESADAKIAALSAGAPMVSRADEIGLSSATTSDIADALLRTA